MYQFTNDYKGVFGCHYQGPSSGMTIYEGLNMPVALLGGVVLLEEVCHCRPGLYDPLPSCLEASLLAFR